MSKRITLLVALAALVLPANAAAAVAHVYFAYGEHGVAVHRNASAGAPATAAVRALLAGPTKAQRAHGLTSAVPGGTKLLGLTVRSGTATVDLTRRFAAGGGSLSMTTRLAQLVYTLTAIRGVHQVNVWLDGHPVRVFSGEGLILTQPLTRKEYPEFVP